MASALALAGRTRGRTAPNPNVGCVLVRDGRVVGRGWTQPGGRPHAEAMALEEAGEAARGAICYTTLEPCAHRSHRGPTCSDLLIQAGVARVIAAIGDPDPRTDGGGFARLRAGGLAVEVGVLADEARRSMAGFLTRRALGRPHVTLKLATSLDGCIALASGESRWITGPESRAHAHGERARHEAILVGRRTLDADAPRLDVRLAGLEDRSPLRVLLTSVVPTKAGAHLQRWPASPRQTSVNMQEMGPRLRGDDGGWVTIGSPQATRELDGIDHLLVEGGAKTAAAFLREDLVDRLLLYRAPIVIGGGLPALGDIGLTHLVDAHGRWRRTDVRTLGADTLEILERTR